MDDLYTAYADPNNRKALMSALLRCFVYVDALVLTFTDQEGGYRILDALVAGTDRVLPMEALTHLGKAQQQLGIGQKKKGDAPTPAAVPAVSAGTKQRSQTGGSNTA